MNTAAPYGGPWDSSPYQQGVGQSLGQYLDHRDPYYTGIPALSPTVVAMEKLADAINRLVEALEPRKRRKAKK